MKSLRLFVFFLILCPSAHANVYFESLVYSQKSTHSHFSEAGKRSFEFIGHEMGQLEAQGISLPPKAVMHGLVGGALSELSGGDFTSGAIATATSHIVAEHIRDQISQDFDPNNPPFDIHDPAALERYTSKIEDQAAAISRAIGGAAAIAVNPDITDAELISATDMSESVVRNNSFKLFSTAVKLLVKVSKLDKINKKDLKRIFKEEGMDIVDDVQTLADGTVDIYDALALIDLATGTSFNSKKIRVAKRNSEISNNNARQLLRSRGATPDQAHEVTSSFEGRIKATQGKAGDKLIITESRPGSASGAYTTRESAGRTPEERIKNLALPKGNSAQSEGSVILTRDQTLLEGRVRSQAGDPDFHPNATGGGSQVFTDAYNNGVKRR